MFPTSTESIFILFYRVSYYSEEREQTPKQNWAVSRLAGYPREGPHILSTLGTDGGSAPFLHAMKEVLSARV